VSPGFHSAPRGYADGAGQDLVARLLEWLIAPLAWRIPDPSELRRRTKTQALFVTEDGTLTVLYGLVACGQIQLRPIDGHHHLPAFVGKTWQDSFS
jgi:hypothetical protein